VKAYVVDPQAPAGVRVADVPEPQPARDEILVAVEAFSLNHGELPRGGLFAAETVPGWDSAGRVLQAASEHAGPAAGTRVVANGPNGAWAERRAVKVANAAVLPDGLDMERASTIPVAGGTALQAVRAVGASIGRRVLITGASGGVGRLALQLARRAGAEVVALTSSEAKRRELEALGAREVVTSLDALSAPLFGAIDLVGGATLVQAWNHLRPGGTLVSIGYASMQPASFPPYGTVGPPRTLLSFQLGQLMLPGETLAEDFRYLAMLMASGELDPQIAWRGPWTKLDEALAGLEARRISGKAVLAVV
jgi:NADPH:quinone reductase-like Zn-dependent oxidoreductase